MYFAVNPWPKDAHEGLLARLQEVHDQASAPCHTYVLLDASFDQQLPTIFPWRRHVECTLYDDTRLSGLKSVAPHLLKLPAEPERQTAWLQTLAEACSGKPMLSLLCSAIPAQALAGHFRPYLLARTEDSLEWPVRWADTRVLPPLLATMSPTEREHFLAPLHAWLCIHRAGEMLAWTGKGLQYPPTVDFDCWPLDDSRFSRLVEEAEADAVISVLYETQPDLFDFQAPAANHACVNKHLAIASRYGIEGAGPRRHFAMLALMLRDDFTQHPAIQAIFKALREGGNYVAEAATLPEDFWQQCTRKPE